MSRGAPAHKLRNLGVAVAVSLAVQTVVFLVIIGGFRNDAAPQEDPAIEVVMIRTTPPPDAPRDVPNAEEPPASPPRARLTPQPDAPPTIVAPMPLPVGDGPPIAAATPAPQPTGPRALDYGCLGKSIPRLKGEERYKCQDEIRAILDRPGRPERAQIERPIDPEKRAAYDAVAARQARQRSTAGQLGNGSSMGCAHSNLGVGCPDDMLIPLGKKGF